ncbi:MAG TPA: VOC family protein [Bryobacteraceae bacterium]|nr:VOC family protein [Bryobacteraceae bacterium]
MIRAKGCGTALAVLCSVMTGACAQVLPADSGPVRLGHLHIVSANPEAQEKFWTGVLGLPKHSNPPYEIYLVPGALIVVQKGSPAGGTDESVVRHIGFKVRDFEGVLAKCQSSGITVVSHNERQAMLEIADSLRVELTADPAMPTALATHHLHFYGRDTNEMRNWYDDVFGAKPGMRGQFIAADLPGINLTFAKSAEAMAGTKGRSLDHIGFEVQGLEAFTKKLQSSGITLVVPYRQVPSLGIAVAFVADPWGTLIELTEGLDKVQ